MKLILGILAIIGIVIAILLIRKRKKKKSILLGYTNQCIPSCVSPSACIPLPGASFCTSICPADKDEWEASVLYCAGSGDASICDPQCGNDYTPRATVKIWPQKLKDLTCSGQDVTAYLQNRCPN